MIDCTICILLREVNEKDPSYSETFSSCPVCGLSEWWIK